MSWSRPCARPRWFWDRWLRAMVERESRFREAAPLAPGPSIFTLKASNAGAKIVQQHGYVEASAERLKGAEIVFDKITVTGTEDLLMAAALADGETVMQNCAREPEVADLADLLNKMGAKIEGAGTTTIRIQGVDQAARRQAPHHSRPHRGGDLHHRWSAHRRRFEIAGCDPKHLGALLQKLEEAGVKMKSTRDSCA